MVVPDRHEGPACTRVLQVRVLQIGAVQRAVVGERRGDAELADSLPVGKAHAIAQPPVVAAPTRPVLRVVDYLVDEITEMQNERELFFDRRVLVLEDHPAVGILRAFTNVLAADEREAHGAWIVRRVGRARTPEATAFAAFSGEAVPIDLSRPQAADQHATRMVGRCERTSACRRYDALECRILGHLDGQRHRLGRAARRVTSPEQDTVSGWVAGSDALSEEISPFSPREARWGGLRVRPAHRRA